MVVAEAAVVAVDVGVGLTDSCPMVVVVVAAERECCCCCGGANKAIV